MGDDDKRIFVGGLRYETDEMTVRNYFIQFGPVTDVKIVKFPPPDGRSKGFGFVRFGTMAAKDHCMSESSHTIDGKAVELRHAVGVAVDFQQAVPPATVLKLWTLRMSPIVACLLAMWRRAGRRMYFGSILSRSVTFRSSPSSEDRMVSVLASPS